jgi:hypothetical protein
MPQCTEKTCNKRKEKPGSLACRVTWDIVCGVVGASGILSIEFWMHLHAATGVIRSRPRHLEITHDAHQRMECRCSPKKDIRSGSHADPSHYCAETEDLHALKPNFFSWATFILGAVEFMAILIPLKVKVACQDLIVLYTV